MHGAGAVAPVPNPSQSYDTASGSNRTRVLDFYREKDTNPGYSHDRDSDHGNKHGLNHYMDLGSNHNRFLGRTTIMNWIRIRDQICERDPDPGSRCRIWFRSLRLWNGSGTMTRIYKTELVVMSSSSSCFVNRKPIEGWWDGLGKVNKGTCKKKELFF